MSADTRLRVMVVDDHPIAGVELTLGLEQSNDFEVVRQAGDGEGAARVAPEVLPDVVVMDVVVPMQGPVLGAVQSGLLDDQVWDRWRPAHCEAIPWKRYSDLAPLGAVLIL